MCVRCECICEGMSACESEHKVHSTWSAVRSVHGQWEGVHVSVSM